MRALTSLTFAAALLLGLTAGPAAAADSVPQAATDEATAATASPVTASAPTAAGPTTIWRVPEALLFDNGPLVTHVGGGAGGADASRLQNSSLLMSTLGFTASVTAAIRIADDFTVPAGGWDISQVTFFGYQTGSTTTSTFNDCRYQIWNGAPNGGGAIIFGDTTTNRFTGSAWSNIYRDTETTVANNQRPIMATPCTGPGPLAAGTYWIDFMLGGTLASGPFIPPVTVLGSTGTGNALQWNAAWVTLSDTGTATQQDVRFLLDGVTTPVELLSFQVE